MYEPTPEFLARRRDRVPIPHGLVAVKSTSRIALIHLVKGFSFGDVARTFRKFQLIPTLCDLPASKDWTLVPRNPNNGHLVSCRVCRHRMTEKNAVREIA